MLKEGADVTSRPTNGQVVTVRYSGRIFEGDNDDVVDSSDSLTFTLGDGDVMMGELGGHYVKIGPYRNWRCPSVFDLNI